MNVHELKNLSEVDRQSVLESESFRVEEQSYMKPLTDQELIEKMHRVMRSANTRAQSSSANQYRKLFFAKVQRMHSVDKRQAVTENVIGILFTIGCLLGIAIIKFFS